MIPYGRQDITAEDIECVGDVLRSDFLTQGPCVPRFEAAVARRVGATHAVAVNSATSALHIACLALGLGPGDRLWTVPNTFVASANCGLYCGASVDFVDIDPETWNIDVALLKAKLEKASRSGALPKVLVPVHFAGQPPDQEAIAELAEHYGFAVLEDASHAIGASHRGEPVGSCRWSRITVLSFHPVKIITSGEGGMALTNDETLAEQMAMLRTHGITRDTSRFDYDGVAPAWHYEQQMLGFNYRMTDIHAALGVSQLRRLDAYVERRNALAARYDRLLAELPLKLPTIRSGNCSAFHLYVARVADDGTGARHRATYDGLRARGIGTNVHYIPVHLQPYYRRLGFAPAQFPEAEAYARTALTLPLFPAMTEDQQDEVVAALGELL